MQGGKSLAPGLPRGLFFASSLFLGLSCSANLSVVLLTRSREFLLPSPPTASILTTRVSAFGNLEYPEGALKLSRFFLAGAMLSSIDR